MGGCGCARYPADSDFGDMISFYRGCGVVGGRWFDIHAQWWCKEPNYVVACLCASTLVFLTAH